MAVTYIGGDSASATSSVSNRVLTIPDVINGDLGILVYGHGTSQATAPAGWTLLNAATNGSAYGEVFWRELHAEDSNSTVTVTVGTIQRQTATLAIYRGGNSLSAANSGTSGAATTHPVPSLSAPAGGAHSIVAIAERNTSHSTAFTPPASHTMRLATYGNGTGACSSAVADNLAALIAEGSPVASGSWTADASAAAIVWTIAITPTPVTPLVGELSLAPESGYAPLVVTATASVTGGTSTPVEYNFKWGDDTETGFQSSNIRVHTYTEPAVYSVATGNPVECEVRNT